MTDRDEDRLGAYAPPADEFDTFDARGEDARRGPLLLTAAAAVFVLFIGVVWSAYHQGVREGGRNQPPRISESGEPFRIRPEDPGGEETRDADLDVYNRLTGEEDTGENAQPRPAPEEPLDDVTPSIRVESDDAPQGEGTVRDADTIPDVQPRQAPPRPQRQPDPEPQTRANTPANAPVDTPAESPAEPQAETPDTSSRPASTPPSSTPAERPEPQAEQPDPVPSRPTATADGNWVVQIASFRTEADAEAAWLAFRTRYSDIASGLAPDVASVEIDGRGTYHRLRIAAFGSREDAAAFCSTLQSRGQDCLVASR